MAYIGRDTDKLSNIEVLDTITFDGSSSYTLQKNSVNFTPSSANNVLVSIDGVVQANNFTTSGSTIDFGVAVPSTSTCDWIYHIGVGLITTPADGTVTTAKLADSSVSLAKLSATGTKDATTFLRGDNTFSTLPAGGITEADNWRITANATGSSAFLTSNWERVDTSAQGYLGTGMTESSGVFTFPSTGIWLVTFQMHLYGGSSFLNGGGSIYSTVNNSTYTQIVTTNESTSAANDEGGICIQSLIDVTDTSNVKLKFYFYHGDTSGQILGSTSITKTGVTFIRLGDT